MSNALIISGAHEHNLKNISLTIPHNAFVVVTGVSGSGKSSLVYDTLYSESQRLFLESLAIYSKSYVRLPEPAKVASIRYLRPSISIDQKTRIASKRSTVGTISEVLDYLRLLYARFGMESDATYLPISTLAEQVSGATASTLYVAVLLAQHQKGTFASLFQKLHGMGYAYVWADGKVIPLTSRLTLPRYHKHSIAVVVDRLRGGMELQNQKITEMRTHLTRLDSEILMTIGDESQYFSDQGRRMLEPHHFSFNSPLGQCPKCQGLGENDAGETCDACLGSRVQENVAKVAYRGLPFGNLSLSTLDEAKTFLTKPKMFSHQVEQTMVQTILERVSVLCELGLGYLTLCRSADTLSGGETQRLRIGSHIALGGSGYMYVLDEPSVGLHPMNADRLIAQLKALAEKNTVIVVEHDLHMVRTSDFVVELGPGGGHEGGEVIYAGKTDRFLRAKTVARSMTHRFLTQKHRKESQIEMPAPSHENVYVIDNIRFRNLDIPKLAMPLRQMVAVVGVSGSGKSTLLFDVLLPKLQADGHTAYWVTQDPVGRTSRSCVATFLEVYQDMRTLFSASPSARLRGLAARDFSFNASPHRCPQCGGTGMELFALQFLPTTRVVCQVCSGLRFTDFVRRITYNGKSIAEVLAMTLSEAAAFFYAYPRIHGPLALCTELGLGYLTLGQSTASLSGGEAQRMKLIYELSRRKAEGHLYLLDEPTTGLSAHDVRYLLKLFARLIAGKNTLWIIEHHTDVIMHAHHVVELGPDGGPQGGRIIAEGPPASVKKNKESRIAPYLSDL